MGAIRALLAKELAHHWRAFTGLTIALAIALLVLVQYTGASERTLSQLQAAGVFVTLFIPLAGVVLGNRLVVEDYHGRNQLFVESLPVRRYEPVLVKFSIGLVYLLVMAWIAVLSVAAVAARTEPVAPEFRLLLLVKVSAFTYLVWGFLFAMGFMGRLRLILYLAVAGIAGYINATTDMDVMRDGPMRLVEAQTFAFEREHWPSAELLQTLALGSACVAWFMALALIRDGTLAESLSRSMSQREKATAGALAIALLFATVALDEKRDKPPYRFTGTKVVKSTDPPVSVLYLRERFRPAARSLLDRTGRSLLALGNAIGIDSFPPVRVALADNLDPGVFQTAQLEWEDGVLVRANFHTLTARQRIELDAYLVNAVLVRTTNGRALFEPKRWLHDGFSHWWVTHGAADRGAHAPPHLVLRALLAAGDRGADSGRVERWARTREALGEPIAGALAYSGLKALEDLAGRDAVLALARAVLGRSPPGDVRETLYEWRHPMPRVFEEALGIEWTAFLAHWNAWLDTHRAGAHAQASLAALPEISATVKAGRDAAGIRALHYRFELTGLARTATCTLLHEKLTPFDDEIPRARLRRVDTRCDNGITAGKVSGLYGAGEIALLILEVHGVDAIGTALRAHAERLVIP